MGIDQLDLRAFCCYAHPHIHYTTRLAHLRDGTTRVTDTHSQLPHTRRMISCSACHGSHCSAVFDNSE